MQERKSSHELELDVASFSLDPEIDVSMEELMHETSCLYASGRISHVEFLRRMRGFMEVTDNIYTDPSLHVPISPHLLDAYQREADVYHDQGIIAARNALCALEPLLPKSSKEVFVANAVSLTAKATGFESGRETVIEEVVAGKNKTDAVVSGGIAAVIQAFFPLTSNYILQDRRRYREEGVESEKNQAVRGGLLLADSSVLFGTLAAALVTKNTEAIVILGGVRAAYNYASHGVMDHLRSLRRRKS